MKTQKQSVCKSCPWRTERDGYYFEPSALKESIVEDHLCERIHSCHSDDTHFCAGYLAFVKSQPDGLDGHSLARLAVHIGLVDVDLIPDINVFATVEDMLIDHQEHNTNRSKYKYHYGANPQL